jgi:hypothetical protein
VDGSAGRSTAISVCARVCVAEVQASPVPSRLLTNPAKKDGGQWSGAGAG